MYTDVGNVMCSGVLHSLLWTGPDLCSCEVKNMLLRKLVIILPLFSVQKNKPVLADALSIELSVYSLEYHA